MPTTVVAAPPSALFPVRKAIVGRLVTDAALVTLLGGTPKVFAPVARQGTPVPFVVYDGGAEGPFSSFRRHGSEIVATLSVEVAVAQYDQQEAIVSRIRALLERVTLALDPPWTPALVSPEAGGLSIQTEVNGVLICRRALIYRVQTMIATS